MKKISFKEFLEDWGRGLILEVQGAGDKLIGKDVRGQAARRNVLDNDGQPKRNPNIKTYIHKPDGTLELDPRGGIETEPVNPRGYIMVYCIVPKGVTEKLWWKFWRR